MSTDITTSNETERNPIPDVLIEAISRIGFEPLEDKSIRMPSIPGDEHLPMGLFAEKDSSRFRFYVRQLPPKACFDQIAWQFAAFFDNIPPELIIPVSANLNMLMTFSKTMTIQNDNQPKLVGIFMNWYQGPELDSTLANTIAAQFRLDLFTALEHLSELSHKLQSQAAAQAFQNLQTKPILH